MTTDVSVTPRDVATLATSLDPAQLDEAVAAIPADLLPRYLFELDAATTLVGKAKNAIKTRMVAEQMIGLKWTAPSGEDYEFKQTGQSKWVGVGELFSLLERLGISAQKLGSAVSECRVMDLKAFAAELPEEDDRRSDAIEAIRNARVWKPGGPSLVAVDNPYRRKKVAARTK